MMNRRTFLTTAAALGATMLLDESVHATSATIQDQGSSPFCLFAVNAHLCDADMWHLQATYFRRNLPTFPNTILPYNENVLSLCADLYGVSWHVADQWQWQQARDALNEGKRVAATGNGHALVLTAWQTNGWIRYLDSLRPFDTWRMTVREFWNWQDGWHWWVT